jgi:hypothetical protein
MSRNNSFATDSSSQSFLLQIDLKEKMTLTKGQEKYAICDDRSYGPAFGGGGDIFITDSCN